MTCAGIWGSWWLMARSCAQPPPAASVMIRISKILMLCKFFLMLSTLLAQINGSERAEDNEVLIHYRSEHSRLKLSLVCDVLQNVSVRLLLLFMFVMHVLCCSKQFLNSEAQNNTFRVVLDQNVTALQSTITNITNEICFFMFIDLSLLYSSWEMEDI